MAVPISIYVDVTVLIAGALADAFQFVPMVVGSHTITANRQDGPYFSLAEVVAAGFTSVATPKIYSECAAIFSPSPNVGSVMIGRVDALDASLTVSLDAIFADDPTTWYLTLIDTNTDADITLLAAWHQANGGGDYPKIAIAQTASAAMLAGTPGNIGEVLRLASYDRCALIYHATDAESLDGAWAGRCLAFDLDGKDGVGDWAYKQLPGQTGAALTGAQATNILAENANYFAPAKGLTFTFNGKMPLGAPYFIDLKTTEDWVKVRTQEKFLSLRVGAPTTIPFDDIGIQFLRGGQQEVFDLGTSAGHFVGEKGGAADPVVTAPLFKDVSTADRTARNIAMQASAIKRGGILTMDFTIYITF